MPDRPDERHGLRPSDAIGTFGSLRWLPVKPDGTTAWGGHRLHRRNRSKAVAPAIRGHAGLEVARATTAIPAAPGPGTAIDDGAIAPGRAEASAKAHEAKADALQEEQEALEE